MALFMDSILLIRMNSVMRQILSQMLTMTLLSLGGECQKKPSWALSYQEWQSYIMSGQTYHDGDSEASAIGKKGNESDEKLPVLTSEDSDDSVESSEGNEEDDSVAIDAPNNKKAGASNICNWGKVIQCNLTALPPLKCQKDGCNILVHHLCQGNWEQSNGHTNTVARYCFSHHPNNLSIEDINWDDDELPNIAGKTVDTMGVCVQGSMVNNGVVENIQNYGGEHVIHDLCVKSANTLPLRAGEMWQGMPRINVISNANAVVHYGMTNEGNVEDPPSGGEDLDLFSNANLRQEVSSNVNRYVKSNSVDFFITGPFHNEKTGRSIWSIVLDDPGKSWACKDTFVQSYLQTLLLKRAKKKPSDINISFCQSFHKINIRTNEFGKVSVWQRKPPKNGKHGQVVRRLSFVYGCPTSNVAKGMTALVEAIKF
jgi:hypothetical protein